MSAPYRSFVAALCSALVKGNAGVVESDLPHFQYNTGLRYGMLGDGEGQTGDPSLVGQWLTAGPVRCTVVSQDIAGHGTLLAGVWRSAPGPWSLIEMDTFGGIWKINDFTFGGRGELYTAMQATSSPIEAYRG